MNVSGKAVAFAGYGPDALCRGLLHAESIVDADITVAKDTADVSTELIIVAGFASAMLVTPPFVATGGARGVTLGFRRAVKFKRAFHLKCAFMLQNTNLTGHA